MADTHGEFEYDKVFTNTEEKKVDPMLYVVLEHDYGGSTFHGCFGSLEDAAKRAQKCPGSDIFKCDLHGNWRQLESYVKIFTIKEVLEDTNYSRQTGGSRMLPARVLERVEGIENARKWIQEYVAKRFTGQHDRVSWPANENYEGRVRADIHTSRVQNPGTEHEHLLGGFYIGLVHTEAALWEYIDCESVTTTTS